MTTSKSLPQAVFSLIEKSFKFEQGAFVLISVPGGVGIKNLVKMFMEGVPLRDFSMPLLASGVLTLVYILVSSYDFITGLKAAKREHLISTGSVRGYIKSDKLWSSVYKFLGVIIINFVLTIFCLLFLVTGMETLYNIFLTAIIGFFLVVISFDLHSVGENHLRRYGKKPEFYVFVDNVAVAIRKGIISKVGRYFGSNTHDHYQGGYGRGRYDRPDQEDENPNDFHD